MSKETVRVITSSEDGRDTAAKSGKIYGYYVGLLMKNGTKQDFSGPHSQA